MVITNLSTPVTPKPLSQTTPNTQKSEKIKSRYLIMVALLGIFVSFWLSRFFPSGSSQPISLPGQEKTLSADQISSTDDIEIGKTYGQTDGNFSDIATGTIEKGNINGVGTHILNRQGGTSQRASLISSVVDLDMFVGKLVEIKGETNSSDKTSWLLDVGSIKILE